MRLRILRFSLQPNYTVGKLYIDGLDTGLWTLEPAVRKEKIPGKTAIPYGIYTLVVDYSPHFGRDLPHLLNVPNFEGVRIHPGNTDADTEGCILLGKEWAGGDFVGRSREAFEETFARIQAALPAVEVEVS